MIKLPLLQASDPVVNRYQTQLQQSLSPITMNPVAAGRLITGINLVTGQVNKVPTGLNAPIQGWILTRLRGNVIVWDTQDSNTTEANTFLYLNCSANVTIDILIC